MGEGKDNYYLSKMRKIIIFRYLSDRALQDVFRMAEIIHYKQDDQIIAEGEVSPYFFAVLEGNVTVSVRQKEGKEIFLCSIGEGDIFGEAGIFLTVQRTANVVSTDSTTLLRIHRKEMLDFVKKQPAAGIKMLMVIIYSLLKKLRDANQELAFERKADIVQEDIDSIVDSIMREG